MCQESMQGVDTSSIMFIGSILATILVKLNISIESFEDIKQKKYPLEIVIYGKSSLSNSVVRAELEVYGILINDLKSWGMI